MKIALASGVLGEKMMVDSVYNCLVNDQGLSNTNLEGDLKVEHQNCDFKAGLLNLSGTNILKREFRPAKKVHSYEL